jgi:hypothetical protein
MRPTNGRRDAARRCGDGPFLILFDKSPGFLLIPFHFIFVADVFIYDYFFALPHIGAMRVRRPNQLCYLR